MLSNKNTQGKMRDKNDPYEVWRTLDGSWEWRVLKKYKSPKGEAKDSYARWFCAVRSPMTYGDFELGDTYVSEIKQYAFQVEGEGRP